MASALLKKMNSPIVVGVIVGMLLLWRVLYFYGAPYAVLVSIIPDDAFYYIEMARHKAFDGWWTFDGLSPTTGFHFLYANLLVIIYQLFDEIELGRLYLAIGLMASLTIAAAAFLVASASRQLWGEQAVWISATAFFLPITVIQSSNMMESWLVIFFSAATLYAMSVKYKLYCSAIAIIMLVGFLGSLSRSDFGLLPGVLFVVECFVSRFSITDRVKKSALILVGAFSGLLFICIYNFHIASHFFSASSEIKYYWSSIVGHDILAPVKFFMMMISTFYFFNKNIVIVSIFLLLLLFIYRLYGVKNKKHRLHVDERTTIPLCCLITIASYLFFYKYNCRGIQNWYCANFIAPIGFLLSATIIFIFRSKAFLVSILLIISYGSMSIKIRNDMTYPENIGKMNAGLYIKAQADHYRYASGNAGIMSYFSNHQIVNIDGLANDEMLPYIRAGTTIEYLKRKKINYVVDYDIQLEHPEMRLRGGYRNDSIQRCLFALHYVDGGAPKWKNSGIRLFQVVDGCES